MIQILLIKAEAKVNAPSVYMKEEYLKEDINVYYLEHDVAVGVACMIALF